MNAQLCFVILKYSQDEEDLDPEDVELDEHYTLETRSKCKDEYLNIYQVLVESMRIIYNCF